MGKARKSSGDELQLVNRRNHPQAYMFWPMRMQICGLFTSTHVSFLKLTIQYLELIVPVHLPLSLYAKQLVLHAFSYKEEFV